MSAAADAHAFVEQQGLTERVAKIAADAPELSSAQTDALRALLWNASPNMTKVGPREPTPIADHRGSPRSERAQRT